MKVVAFNGSPRKAGNTHTAIELVTEKMVEAGVDVEIIHVGNKIIRGCLACNHCAKSRDERCVIDDEVNERIQKM